MQSVVETIIEASERIQNQEESIDNLNEQIAADDSNFDDIYDALVAKGQSPTEDDRSTYAPCIANLNRAGSFQNKTVTPDGTEKVIIADQNYLALQQVTVAGDEYLLPENIKQGITIYGVTGTYNGA